MSSRWCVNGVARAIAVVGLVGVSLIHVLDAPDTFQGSLYKGLLYVGLILGCMGAAGVLIRTSDWRAWLVTVVLPLGSAVAFIISRTIGLPQGADDIGNWTQSLGLASLFVEASVVALGVMVLRERFAGSARTVAAWPVQAEMRCGPRPAPPIDRAH